MQIKLADKYFYNASINKKRWKLLELQKLDKKFKKIRVKGLSRYKKIDKVL